MLEHQVRSFFYHKRPQSPSCLTFSPAVTPSGAAHLTLMRQETVKHFEFIQAVITRLAGNSFLLKGWNVTISAALFALAGAGTKPVLVLVALFPTVTFWGLDAYYLREERLFRALYDDLRLSSINGNQSGVETFSLSTEKYKSQVPSWFQTLWSPTVFAFHGGIVAAILCAILVIWLIPVKT